MLENMKILLIGNFAPPYEEENLHNISLLRKLEEDGHTCTVINISENPSEVKSFINASSNAGYLLKLLRHGMNKDVIHFMTKGYLRVGLLKLMLAIFAGTLLRTRKILTIHSEFFSILGQMRSPFGGTQTLNTSFYLADRIIFTDKDTFEVGRMYMKKANFELIPSFIYIPEDIKSFETTRTARMKDMKSVVLFSNVKHPSFLFDVIIEFITRHSLPEDMGMVIMLSDKPSLKLENGLSDTSGPLKDRLIFIEYDDVQSALKVCSKSSTIVKPMSCDGQPLFKSLALCIKQAERSGNYVSFPAGMVLVKEGSARELCANIFNALFHTESGSSSESDREDPYGKIIKIYEK